MRGFLKSREGIFQLALSTTTIGREGCDLFLSVSIHSNMSWSKACLLSEFSTSLAGLWLVFGYVLWCCLGLALY